MSTVLELYEKLKPKLGQEESRALLEFVEASVERRAVTKEDLLRIEAALKEDLQQSITALSEELQQMALKEDLQRATTALREELQRMALKEDLQRSTAALREDFQRTLREEIQRTELMLREDIHRLDVKIEATKADLLKWTFAFWIGNVAVLSGIMFAIVRAFAGK